MLFGNVLHELCCKCPQLSISGLWLSLTFIFHALTAFWRWGAFAGVAGDARPSGADARTRLALSPSPSIQFHRHPPPSATIIQISNPNPRHRLHHAIQLETIGIDAPSRWAERLAAASLETPSNITVRRRWRPGRGRVARFFLGKNANKLPLIIECDTWTL